jgi:hypothetical protein
MREGAQKGHKNTAYELTSHSVSRLPNSPAANNSPSNTTSSSQTPLALASSLWQLALNSRPLQQIVAMKFCDRIKSCARINCDSQWRISWNCCGGAPDSADSKAMLHTFYKANTGTNPVNLEKVLP